jgi:uncharacterized membrane protein
MPSSEGNRTGMHSLIVCLQETTVELEPPTLTKGGGCIAQAVDEVLQLIGERESSEGLNGDCA